MCARLHRWRWLLAAAEEHLSGVIGLGRRWGLSLCAVLLVVGIGISLPSCRLYSSLTILGCDREEDLFLVGRPPLDVCLTADGLQGTPAVFEWDFGDGTITHDRDASHTYTEVGEYDVKLQVTYTDGTMETDTTHVSVAGEPVAAFAYRPISTGLFGSIYLVFGWEHATGDPDSLTIEFDAATSYPPDSKDGYHPQTLAWQFGDGAQETKWVPSISGFMRGWPMRVVHEYAAAGTYEVTLTLTDNLGYSDSVTQTVTVGPQGGDDEDLVDGFALGAVQWEADDEEEEDACLWIHGTVTNNNSVAAGVELTATAYAGAVSVGSIAHWPAGNTNISAGADQAFGFYLCDLSVPADQVTSVVVEVTDAVVY
jgi:PKD repeat protein